MNAFVRAGLISPLLAGVAFAADFDAAAATNQIGLDVYRQLAAGRPAGNLIISPYSIGSALALAFAGADGLTHDEMATALHFPADEASLRQGFATLRTSLDALAAKSTKIAEGRDRAGPQAHAIIGGKRVELQGEPAAAIEWHAANRLFGQSGYAFRDAFLALMRDGYAAPFESLDFRRDAENARLTIDHWVEEQTQDKIRDLIPRGGLDRDSRLVLVNALYLKAPWETPFEKSLTSPQPFHLESGDSRDVPTMRRTAFLGYAHERGFTVVALKYLGGELQCLVLLPDEGQSLDAAEAKLTPADFARWAQIGTQTRPIQVALYLPKFRIEGATLPLGPALRRLGMRSAFDEPRGSANFDRIAPRRPDDYLLISEVFHRTFVALDEEGTEAAAATAVAMMSLAMVQPQKPIEVRVDRPFLFALQHRGSGACLFLGRIADPR